MRALPVDRAWGMRGLALVAAVELFVIGYILNDPGDQPTARTLQAGGLSVAYGEQWSPEPRPELRSRLGLAVGSAGLVREDGSRVAIGSLGEADPSARLAALFAGPLPAPRPVEVGGTPALAYGPAGSPPAAALVFTRRSGERLAFACLSATRSDVCSELAPRAAGADLVASGPGADSAAVLRTAIAAAAAAARGQAGRLGSASLANRAQAAQRLATAHNAIDRTATAAAGREPWQRAELASLARAARLVANDFGALARAARQRRRADYARLATRLQTEQAKLRSVIEALRAQGYAVGNER